MYLSTYFGANNAENKFECDAVLTDMSWRSREESADLGRETGMQLPRTRSKFVRVRLQLRSLSIHICNTQVPKNSSKCLNAMNCNTCNCHHSKPVVNLLNTDYVSLSSCIVRFGF